jgi:hypothetical protein
MLRALSKREGESIQPSVRHAARQVQADKIFVTLIKG